MAKRRTDSDSEDEKPSAGLKRARTIDSDEDDENFEIPSNLQTKGKAKGRNVTFDEGEEEDEADEEAEDNRFEQQHRETILAGLEEKRKVHGVRVFLEVLFLKSNLIPVCAFRALQNTA
jgi:structural maintenance of chromosomes protein 6